jgi:hypothetical protein
VATSGPEAPTDCPALCGSLAAAGSLRVRPAPLGPVRSRPLAPSAAAAPPRATFSAAATEPACQTTRHHKAFSLTSSSATVLECASWHPLVPAPGAVPRTQRSIGAALVVQSRWRPRRRAAQRGDTMWRVGRTNRVARHRSRHSSATSAWTWRRSPWLRCADTSSAGPASTGEPAARTPRRGPRLGGHRVPKGRRGRRSHGSRPASPGPSRPAVPGRPAPRRWMQVQSYTRACPVCKAGVEVDKVRARTAGSAARRPRRRRGQAREAAPLDRAGAGAPQIPTPTSLLPRCR